MRVSRLWVTAFVGAGVGLAVLVPTTAAPALDATSPVTVPCRDGSWSELVLGSSPTFKAGAAAGVYLWKDTKGWHLRVTHPGKNVVTFSGTVQSDVPVTDKRLIGDRKGTLTTTATDSFSFKFQNVGQAEGLDFRSECATTLYFWFTINGKKLPVKAVRIGGGDRNPLTNPFVLVPQR